MPKVKHIQNRGKIKAMYEAKNHPKDIAAKFGCSVQYVYMVANPQYEAQVNESRQSWAKRKQARCPITGF